MGPFGDSNPELYARGWFESQGTTIGIRYWNEDAPNIFHVHRQIPQEWIGTLVTLMIGCHQTPGFCESVHSNLDRFNAIAINTPGYDPNLETGGVS